MSKLKQIAERLVKEIKDEGVKRVEVFNEGNVEIYGDGEFKVQTVEMDEDEYHKVKLPTVLPARVGKKAFRKLDKQVSDSGFSVDDPDSLLDAKDFLIDEMMKQSNEAYRADELTMQSYNRIGNYYWDKVVEAEKKRSD